MSFHFYFPTFYFSNYRQNPKCLIEGKNDFTVFNSQQKSYVPETLFRCTLLVMKNLFFASLGCVWILLIS